MSTSKPSVDAQARETIGFLALAAAELAGVSDLTGLAAAIHSIVSSKVAVEYSAIYFLNTETDTFQIYFAGGFTDDERREAERTAMDRHPGRVLRTGERLYVPDTWLDSQQQTQDSTRQIPVRARLFLPVKSEGRCVGAVGLASAQPDPFNDLHFVVLEFVCQLAGVVYKNVDDSRQLRLQLARVRRQEQELRRLASPFIEVWEHILAMPLIGTVDVSRLQLVSEQLLSAVAERRVRIVILDLTGVESIEATGLQQLLRLSNAIRLLGSRCFLSGMSPLLAQQLALAGQDLAQLTTFRTLRQALASVVRDQTASAQPR